MLGRGFSDKVDVHSSLKNHKGVVVPPHSSWVASEAGVPLAGCTSGVPGWGWFGDGGDVRLPGIRLLLCVLTSKNSRSTGAGPWSGRQRVMGAGHKAAPSQAVMLRSTFSLTVEGRGDREGTSQRSASS